MRRDDVIAKLKAAEPKLRASGAAGLYLFGSVARDQARSNSDIDVFVDKDPGNAFGFDAFMDVYRIVRDALDGAEIGYSTRDGLVSFYRQEIEEEAIQVF